MTTEPTLDIVYQIGWETAVAEWRKGDFSPEIDDEISAELGLAVDARWRWVEGERTRLVEENRRLYLELERWQSFDVSQAMVAEMERDGE